MIMQQICRTRQTLLARMRIFCETGTALYNGATQATDDLRKQGFTVGELATRGTKSKGISKETLARLLPRETTETRHGGVKTHPQRQIQEKLKEYL